MRNGSYLVDEVWLGTKIFKTQYFTRVIIVGTPFVTLGLWPCVLLGSGVCNSGVSFVSFCFVVDTRTNQQDQRQKATTPKVLVLRKKTPAQSAWNELVAWPVLYNCCLTAYWRSTSTYRSLWEEHIVPLPQYTQQGNRRILVTGDTCHRVTRCKFPGKFSFRRKWTQKNCLWCDLKFLCTVHTRKVLLLFVLSCKARSVEFSFLQTLDRWCPLLPTPALFTDLHVQVQFGPSLFEKVTKSFSQKTKGPWCHLERWGCCSETCCYAQFLQSHCSLELPKDKGAESRSDKNFILSCTDVNSSNGLQWPAGNLVEGVFIGDGYWWTMTEINVWDVIFRARMGRGWISARTQHAAR